MVFETKFVVDTLDERVIYSVIEEKTNSEIAEELGYSLGFIKRRLAYLFDVYGVKTKVGLVREVLKGQLCFKI